MEVVLHIGVHGTDEGRIADWLGRSAPALEAEGVRVVPPATFRPALHEATQGLRGSPAPRDVEARLLERLCGGITPDRLVLSHESLAGSSARVLEPRGLYPGIGTKIVALRNLFPSHRVEMALAVRNPVTALPAILSRQADLEAEDFYARAIAYPPDWTEVVTTLRNYAPDCTFTVWRHEDLLVLWPEVGAALLGQAAAVPVLGMEQLVAPALSDDGFAKLRDYLNAAQIVDARQGAKVGTIFAARFPAVADVAEPAEWPDDARAAAARAYADLPARIDALSHVRMLLPA